MHQLAHVLCNCQSPMYYGETGAEQTNDASKETIGFSRLMAVDSNWQQIPDVTVIILDEQAGRQQRRCTP